MWWNPAKMNISTNIANVEFWHSTCKERVKNFTKPVHIFFELKRNAHGKVLKDYFSTPFNFKLRKHEELNGFIKVRRVTLEKNKAVRVNFHDLDEHQVFYVIKTCVDWKRHEKLSFRWS